MNKPAINLLRKTQMTTKFARQHGIAIVDIKMTTVSHTEFKGIPTVASD